MEEKEDGDKLFQKQEQEEGRGHCGRKEGQVMSGGLQEGGFQESLDLLYKYQEP